MVTKAKSIYLGKINNLSIYKNPGEDKKRFVAYSGKDEEYHGKTLVGILSYSQDFASSTGDGIDKPLSKAQRDKWKKIAKEHGYLKGEHNNPIFGSPETKKRKAHRKIKAY